MNERYIYQVLMKQFLNLKLQWKGLLEENTELALKLYLATQELAKAKARFDTWAESAGALPTHPSDANSEAGYKAGYKQGYEDVCEK